ILVQLSELTGPGHRGTDAAAGPPVARGPGSAAGRFAAFGIADPRAPQRPQNPIPAAGPTGNGNPPPLSSAGTAPACDRRSVCLPQRSRSRRPYDSVGITLIVSISSPHYRREEGQPTPVSAHICFRYGARRRQPTGPDAVDGPRTDSNDDGLCRSHPS